MTVNAQNVPIHFLRYHLGKHEGVHSRTTPRHAPSLGQTLREKIAKWNIPAMSIGIVNEDEVLAMSCGYADIEEKIENRPSTLYYGASTTKAFTAAAFASLAEDSTQDVPLQWGTKLRDIDPENFRLADQELTERVTVEDALSHCTGMPSHENSLLVEFNPTEEDAESYLKKVGALPIGDLSKGQHRYTNFMYVVMSVLFYILTGRRLEQFLRETIWDKLEMNHTSFDPDKVSSSSEILSTGYTWSDTYQSYKPLPKRKYSGLEGSCAIVSNVLDYSKWVHCLIQQGGPISVAGHQALTRPRAIKSCKFGSWAGVTSRGYALGWSTVDYKGHHVAYHTGTLPGFSSLVMFSVSLKWGVVAFSNTDQRGLDLSSAICWGLLDDLLGAPHEARSYWKRNMVRRASSQPRTKSTRALFPELPDIRAPTSFCIEGYLGDYEHAAYGTYHVRSRGNVLFIDALHLPCRSVYTFEHVHGDWFLVKQHQVDWDRTKLLKANFHVEDRKVTSLGIAFNETMVDDMILFARVSRRK